MENDFFGATDIGELSTYGLLEASALDMILSEDAEEYEAVEEELLCCKEECISSLIEDDMEGIYNG